jgi:hypothetical protein
VVALASRDRAKGEAARALGIARARPYEELPADLGSTRSTTRCPTTCTPWSIRARRRASTPARPIGLSVAEVEELRDARPHREAGVKSWCARTRSGRAARLERGCGRRRYGGLPVSGYPEGAEWGGGALLDIGCYPITIARFLFDAEPRRVAGCLELDPRFGTDRLASGVMEFGEGQSVFTCATQAAPYQRVQVIGTRGRIEVEIPFNAPRNKPCRVFLDDGHDLSGAGIETITFPACDQYTIQGDLFSQAILDGTPVPIPLEDAIAQAQDRGRAPLGRLRALMRPPRSRRGRRVVERVLPMRRSPPGRGPRAGGGGARHPASAWRHGLATISSVA